LGEVAGFGSCAWIIAFSPPHSGCCHFKRYFVDDYHVIRWQSNILFASASIQIYPVLNALTSPLTVIPKQINHLSHCGA